MNKNYKFNSVSLDIDDGVLENLFNIENSKSLVDLSKYPLKKMMYHAFYGNYSIKEIILPETLEEIDDYSLCHIPNLEKINFPSSIKKVIGGQTLSNTKIYDDETNWSGNCFYYHGWLLGIRDGDIVIPDNVKLPSDIASFNSRITSVHFPASIKEIPDEFLYYLSGVTSITFDSNSKLERIGNYAIYCPNLTEIKLPESIKYMGTYAIRGKIQKVYITNLKKFCEIEKGSSTFYGTEGFDIYLNNSILKNVIFPSDLTIIKPHTFYYSNIESITIPKTVKEIGAYCLSYCKKLKDIKYLGTVSEWNSITKLGYSWHGGVLATYVQCTDGQVQL